MASRRSSNSAASRPEADVAAAAFRGFYRGEFGRVFGYLLALTGDPAVAEDLAQETFTRAYRDWTKVSGLDRPGAWTRTVAHNLAMSRFRRLRSEAKAMLKLRGDAVATVPPEDPTDRAFWAEVRRLPARQAQALILFYLDDLPVVQIAEVMGCAEGTAKSHLHRGRKALAARLGLAADPATPTQEVRRDPR